VSVENAYFVVEVEGVYLLPELSSDTIVSEAEEELLFESAGERRLQISTEYVCGCVVGIVLVMDVTKKCVHSVERLSMGSCA